MSADELRKAAQTLRANPYTAIRSTAPSALADWFDHEAEHVASHDCEAHCAYPDGGPRCRSALTVARLIIGGAA